MDTLRPLDRDPVLCREFAHLDLHLTFFVPGWLIEKYPVQIDLLLKNGHEIALHGYLHEQSNEIDKGRAVLARTWARRLSQTHRHRAARLAGAELCVFKTFAALPV